MPNFTRYRALAAVLLAALPALAFQCGCDDCTPCPTELLGSLRQPAGLGTWLPEPAPDSVRFINSNGFRATLRREALPADSIVQSAYIGPSDDYTLLNGSASGACGAYFRVPRLRLRYSGRNLPLTLTYALVRDFSGLYPPPAPQLSYQSTLTRAVADTLPGVVLVSFNTQFISRFPVTSRPYRQVFQGTRYLDSVRVAGRLLRGVYWHAVPATGSTLQLRDLYYQPGQGVVGFTYSNNEQWARF
jgi:hypothetical protein